METCDVMQAGGTENPVRFYVCRIMPFDDNAAVKQNKRGCAWVGNGKCNKQNRSWSKRKEWVCSTRNWCQTPTPTTVRRPGVSSAASWSSVMTVHQQLYPLP